MNQEQSTARTGSHAPDPLRDAIYIVETVGLTDGRVFADKMPRTERWDNVRGILSRLNIKQNRKAILKHLRVLLGGDV